MTGTFLSEEDQEKYEKWTKMEIYEAYLVETIARKVLNAEVNRLVRKLAEIRYKAGEG